MRKILVTAISGNVANGILKILRKSDDEIFGCDIYDYPVGIDKVKICWKSDLATTKEYIPNLLKKCKQYHITHIIPVNESEISVISNNRNVFEEQGIKLVINNSEIINSFMDKYETYKCLSLVSNVNIAKTMLPKEYDEDGIRYIAKLKNSCGSKFLKLIESKKDLEAIDKNILQNCVLQQYLDDCEQEYTVGVFSNGENVDTIIYKRKLEHGFTSFVEYVEDDAINKMACDIAKYMNLRGAINIQIRKQDNVPYIFEINPRISGTVYFRHMLGFDDVVWWLNCIDGNLEYTYEKKYERAIGVRELAEKYIILE